MSFPSKTKFLFLALLSLTTLISTQAHAQDPLPSWNNTANKHAILLFVAKVTDEDSADFVPREKRIATFDNDGTLWVEHPMYTQLAFALDRIKRLAPDHPEWKETQPFKAALEGDMKTLAAAGMKGLGQLIMTSHAGISTEEFEEIVKEWFATAKHPRFKRPYTECVYQPMVELLAYLRASGFKTYIVSGGGIEFMRPMTEVVYGVPPEQVIGSTIQTEFEIKDGKPVLMRLPKMDFVDDKAGKAININKIIGRRPIASFGNTPGDKEMLEWTAAGKGQSLKMLVFHDDDQREYAYGPANGLPNSPFGAFPQDYMDEAKEKGWHIISMKNDWARIFSFEQ